MDPTEAGRQQFLNVIVSSGLVGITIESLVSPAENVAAVDIIVIKFN
jgi:hypothetical protein